MGIKRWCFEDRKYITYVRLWQLPSIKGKVDVEEKGNGPGTADIGNTIVDYSLHR